MTTLRTAAQQALEALEALQGGCTDHDDGTVEAITVWCPEIITALRAALAEPVQEPVQGPWATQERFYEALDRAVESVKQDMKVKTVTLRLPEYGMAMPIIDAYSGHVLVGPVSTPPQRKPLTEEEIRAIMRPLGWDGEAPSDLLFARAVEAAHGIKEGT